MNCSRFLDDSFESINTPGYRLSIRCSTGGFSFLVSDPSTLRHLMLSEHSFPSVTPYSFKLEFLNALKQEPVLNLRFQETRIGWQSSREMLVPDNLIPSDRENLLFNSILENKRDETIYTAAFQEKTCSFVFALPNLIRDLFRDLYPNCQFFPQSLATFQPITNGEHTLSIRVDKWQHDLTIAVFQNKKISFLNHFFVKSETDCLYYMLQVSRLFVSGPETELILSGRIDPKSELAERVKKRFPRIVWAQHVPPWVPSYTFHAEPAHYHFPLTQLAICG
ncbi:MAG TPA: DUF3822 family protein [Prolixibacteraceae bacterium]|nr:DUF3822 family protein [Prolixibacteraceae bacterium]